MKLYSLFLLLGLILCDEGYNNETYHFYDININERYYVDTTRYIGGYLPSNHTYFFVMPISSIDEVVIQLQTSKSNLQPFEDVNICGFTFRPTIQDVVSHNGELCKNISEFDKNGNNNINIYTILFPITESLRNSIQYISFSFKAVEPIYYLEVYPYVSEKIEAKIYDISYKKEFKLNSTDLQNQSFIFKTIYEKEENGIIQLKTNKNFILIMNLEICYSGI